MTTEAVTITHLSVRQYKSIESLRCELGPLTILVGRNGVGKSNIIDALAFVGDALRDNLDLAIRQRGGINQVRRKSSSKPTVPVIKVGLRLPHGAVAHYMFRLGVVKDAGFKVQEELCEVRDIGNRIIARFHRRDGMGFEWSFHETKPPVLVADRLLLNSVSNYPGFDMVYAALVRTAFHNFNPEVMKREQPPEASTFLNRDGSNLASVVKHLSQTDESRLERVTEYLRAIGVPVRRVSHKQAGSLETIEVLQDRGEGNRPANFDAISLSDGTIRALGMLLSLQSLARQGESEGPTLIGIEEPETALHPAAVGALMDALLEGARTTKLIMTCHSPDLLEHPNVQADMLRVVLLTDSGTKVGRVAPQKAQLLKDHLATAGELLRLDQLEPDEETLEPPPDDLLPWPEEAPA
jgi:predicted ATPase